MHCVARFVPFRVSHPAYIARGNEPAGGGLFQERGMDCRKFHHTWNVGIPIRGNVRATFGNLVACNLIASRDGPGYETPFVGSCMRDLPVRLILRISGFSRLAPGQNQDGSHFRRS